MAYVILLQKMISKWRVSLVMGLVSLQPVMVDQFFVRNSHTNFGNFRTNLVLMKVVRSGLRGHESTVVVIDMSICHKSHLQLVLHGFLPLPQVYGGDIFRR